MKTQEINTEYGSLEYEVCQDHVVITGYRGRDVNLTIPVNIDEKPVTVIGKKAFLSAKGLKHLILPGGIERIQDWAFASCDSLEAIALPVKKVEIGQGILKDCRKLQRIVTAEVQNETTWPVSYLLAAAVVMLDASYLFNLESVGSADWLEQWDARMLSLMEQEDTEGFSKMLLCGEEDYGSRDNDIDYYIEQKRRFKVRLAMLRLMHDIGLEPSVRDILLSYLQSHKKGEASEETWKVVLEEHGDERQYYQFLISNGCITEENIDAVLEDMGDRHTEMKAFLMNYRNAYFHKEDAFSALRFDL